jgi:hypothetical protein
MFAFELLVLVYCASLGVTALVLPRVRHRRSAVAAAGAAAATVTLAALGELPAWARLFILPHCYIGAGYWIPAMLVPVQQPSGGRTRFERWLVRSDERVRPHLPPLPRSVAQLAELAYLACYPLVPICVGLVWLRGEPSDLVRYWTTVIAAGFACYVSLPWLVSRPPSMLIAPDDGFVPRVAASDPLAVARLNRWVLSRVSHRWTTFPSGHVAVACAAAAALGRVWPAAGAVAGIVAAGVAIGAVAGRYHFVVDVLAGVAVTVVVLVVTWAR